MAETILFFGVCIALYFLLSWVPSGNDSISPSPPPLSPELEEAGKRRAALSRILQISLNRIYWLNKDDELLVDAIKEWANRNVGGWYCLEESEVDLVQSYTKLGQGQLYNDAVAYLAEYGEPLTLENRQINIVKSSGKIAMDLWEPLVKARS